MALLASAQPFGFGPIAKLVGVVAQFDAVPVTFAGRSIALRFAQLNDDHFAAVREFDLSDTESTRWLVRSFDGALSVMESNLVYAAVREERPVYFFDSLFAFWQSGRTMQELAAVARTVRTASDDEAARAFTELTVHESMIVCHMMATRSFAQIFPGVDQRIEELRVLGVETVMATGSMIDKREIVRSSSEARDARRVLVANLGGYNNAFVDYASHGAYCDVMVRWLERVAERTTSFDEIIICSGAFSEPTERVVAGVRLRTGLLSHAELLDLLAGGPTYLAPPGLTSLHEAVALELPLMLLPDQHYGHQHNRQALQGTALHTYGACFSRLEGQPEIPHDDLEGSMVLARIASDIKSDITQFEAFCAEMDQRLDTFTGLDQTQLSSAVDELDLLFDGAPISEVVAELNRTRQADTEEAQHASA